MKKTDYRDDFAEHLGRFVGETVTVFTAGGGLSGRGFTGVVLGVDSGLLRLATRIGAAPGRFDGGCRRTVRHYGSNHVSYLCGYRNGVHFGDDPGGGAEAGSGSAADIPICLIVAFVHTMVGYDSPVN